MPRARNRYRIVTFKVDPRTLAMIDKAALELRMSRSDLIREAIHLYIKTFMLDKYLRRSKQKD